MTTGGWAMDGCGNRQSEECRCRTTDGYQACLRVCVQAEKQEGDG